jgi:hypothetical protein
MDILKTWEYQQMIDSWDREIRKLQEGFIESMAGKMEEGLRLAKRAPDFSTMSTMWLTINRYLNLKRYVPKWRREIEERVKLPQKAKVVKLEVVQKDKGGQK